MSDYQVGSPVDVPAPDPRGAVPASDGPASGRAGAGQPDPFPNSRRHPDPWSPPRFGAANEDTARQQVVDLPVSSKSGASAAGDVERVLLVRAALTGVAAALLVTAAVLLFQHGVRPNDFPAYAAGTTRTVVERYSGPWIGGAAAAALVAGLCLVSFGADLWRRRRLQHSRRPV